MNIGEYRILTKDDLKKESFHRPYWNIDIYKDFPSSKLSLDSIRNFNIIIFKEGFNIQILKNRYGPDGLHNPTNSGELFIKLNKKTPGSVKQICNKQQYMLSNILDKHSHYFLTPNQISIISTTLQNRWFWAKDREELNKIKKLYTYR